MIMPVTLSVITTSFPADERAKAVGVWAGVAGGGGIIGLFVSAAIVDNSTWPWVFAFPIALAVLAFVGTVAVVPHSRSHAEGGFDVAGSVLSAFAVGGLVLGFHEGPERGWTDPVTIAGFAVGVVAAAGFVRIELRRDHPLLDVREFARPGLATGSVNLFVIFAVMFSLFLVLVQFLQAALGYPALRAATGLLPMAVVMMPLAAVSPTIADRWGYRRTVTTGMVLTGLSLGLMALLADEERGYLSILIPLLLQGAGVRLSMSPSTTAITASLPEEKQGVASALNDTVREMGGAIGIALLGSVLNSSYRSNVSATAERLPPDLAEPVKEGIGGAIAVASQMGAEGAGVMQAARAAFTDGMRPALMIGMAVSLATAAYTTLSGRRVAAQPSEPAVDAVDTKLLGG